MGFQGHYHYYGKTQISRHVSVTIWYSSEATDASGWRNAVVLCKESEMPARSLGAGMSDDNIPGRMRQYLVVTVTD